MPQIVLPLEPTRYLNADGSVTPMLVEAFNRVSLAYFDIAEFSANKMMKRHLPDFAIREVQVVGSVLRGVNNSDLDLLILADKIDWEDYRLFKLVLAATFFNNRSKYSALDVYVQPEDDRPENLRWNVTHQLAEPIKNLNVRLGYNIQ